MPSLHAMAAALEKRQRYDCPSGYSYDGYYGCVSPWYLYGRWILVGAIIVGAFLLFCAFSCCTARRRRRQGLQPFRGTGWASGGPGGAAYPPPQNYYNNNAGGYNYGGPQQGPPGGWQAPPPQYSAPPDGTHYGKANPGGEPYGAQPPTELQSPVQAHHHQAGGSSYQPQYGGDNVYAPPPGPPPNKDGIIR